MRKSIFLPLIGAITIAACNDSTASTTDAKVTPSGQQGQRQFQLANFDTVSLEGPDNVEVRVGPAFSVTAQGDTGVLKALEIKLDGSELEIGRKNQRSGFRWGNDEGDEAGPLKVIVTMPAIRAANLAGSGDMSVDKVSGDSFDAALAGSGDMLLGALAVKTAELSIAGSGDIKASGAADQVSVSIAGSGDADGSGLAAKAADVSIAGSGNVRLAVDGAADVSIVGSGDVDLGPKARCQKSIMGAGDVICGG
ncbi:DUF2807 domain-containing protein [Sphingomonas gilva]|uniref:DUF2807 domain-containing protein n=1 Tax=Sphingomonas gilva TaxID=2305907 RepID=A0A396RQD0_9SPHN|nr:head GIN domain-containing protein [Sphingomonas gilva]RHW18678.1 DUF2807 domain-containing protein [Sphingomonas gilva]